MTTRCFGSAFVLLVALCGGRASATPILYATSLGGQQIEKVDITTNTVTPVFNTVGTPDSLVFAPNGDIIYTNLGSGQVRDFNLITHVDTVLASGFSDPADLAVDPSKTKVLVSDFLGGTIKEINLTTHTLTTLGTYGGNPQGLAFDGSGDLFAVLGTRTGSATSFVAQLDPTTGAILKQSSNEVQLDGLTYDPFSGMFYAPSLSGNGIFQVNPLTLSATLLTGSTGVAFDGITTDSVGDLFIANSGNRIYQYNLLTSTLTPETVVSGLDDLAPATGLGAPPAVPEPATLTLLGTGLLAVARRRFARRR